MVFCIALTRVGFSYYISASSSSRLLRLCAVGSDSSPALAAGSPTRMLSLSGLVGGVRSGWWLFTGTKGVRSSRSLCCPSGYQDFPGPGPPNLHRMPMAVPQLLPNWCPVLTSTSCVSSPLPQPQPAEPSCFDSSCHSGTERRGH